VRIRVTKRADAHIEQAGIWWEQNRPLSPGALGEELAAAFTLLISQPAIGAPALNAKTRGVRRVHLARVHYYLYYRVRGEQIEVLAFWHTSRGTPPPV
jgi:plasmid stabilization system protein ParE